MRKWTILIGVLAAAGSMSAQTFQRRAVFANGGDPNGGKCTIEVMVDKSAEVEIRGDTGTLRNTGGQNPQWRRFECTGPMPADPSNFRFAGVDGRGRQTLTGDPRNNRGTAVVRIEDSQGGAEGYTFDLFWGDRAGPISGDRNRQDRRFDGSGPQPSDRGRFGDQRGPDGARGDFRDNRNFTETQAVQVCQDYVKDRAVSRFRTQNINFLRTSIDDNPGRRDWVTGELAVHRWFGRQNIYRFSCSVNFRTGQVRTAQIDQFERDYYPEGR
jgi:hypothetical protein